MNEAEQLVENGVDEQRQRLVDKHENLIEAAVDALSDKPFREMNVVFSEVRRRLEEAKDGNTE